MERRTRENTTDLYEDIYIKKSNIELLHFSIVVISSDNETTTFGINPRPHLGFPYN